MPGTLSGLRPLACAAFAFSFVTSTIDVSVASAQTSDVVSSISGVVEDATQAAVPNAVVTATSTETGLVRTVQSAANGTFTVPLLPIGPYVLSVSAANFERFQQKGIDVRLGYAAPVTVLLKTGSTSETVTVDANSSILDTETFDVSDGLNQRSIENAPITSRNTFNLALLVPGLNGTRDDEFGNPTFALGGMQRKAFLIDGVDNTQRGGPGWLGIFSPEEHGLRVRDELPHPVCPADEPVGRAADWQQLVTPGRLPTVPGPACAWIFANASATASSSMPPIP